MGWTDHSRKETVITMDSGGKEGGVRRKSISREITTTLTQGSSLTLFVDVPQQNYSHMPLASLT